MTSINGSSFCTPAYEDFQVHDAAAPSPTANGPDSQVPVDSYGGYVAPADSGGNVVLPYESPSATEQQAAPQNNGDAAQVLAQLTSPDAVFTDPAQGEQAANALSQLLALSDGTNAQDLAPAIAFWTEVGQASLAETQATDVATNPADTFDANADFKEVVGPEVEAAWEQIIVDAQQNLEAMLDGPHEVDPSLVTEMQGALADANYALAVGAQFEGNTGAAMEAAALALSYVDSMQAAGADVSQYENLVSDMKVLIDTGVLNLSYMEMNAIVDTGQVVAVGNDGQPVTFDIRDLAMMADVELPEGIAPPLVDPDPTTDVGYDGAGMVLDTPATSVEIGSSIELGSMDIGSIEIGSIDIGSVALPEINIDLGGGFFDFSFDTLEL